MALAFRSVSHAASAGTASFVAVTKPSGAAARDLLVASAVEEQARRWADPDGWIRVRTEDDTGWSHTTWYRVADGTEGSTFTFNLVTSSAKLAVIVLAYQGGAGAAPVDAHNGQSYVENSTEARAPTVTPTRPNDLLVMFFGWRTPAGSAPTYPAGTTGRAYQSTGGTASMAAADEDLASASATPTKTAVGPLENDRRSGQQVAFFAAADDVTMLV